jgi:hypothetical protein
MWGVPERFDHVSRIIYIVYTYQHNLIFTKCSLYAMCPWDQNYGILLRRMAGAAGCCLSRPYGSTHPARQAADAVGEPARITAADVRISRVGTS